MQPSEPVLHGMGYKPTGPSLLSALEFAVNALHVREVIVCSHYGWHWNAATPQVIAA